LGWSGKKIGISFCGLIIAYLGYAILTYVALLAGGERFGAIWGTFGLYPWVCGSGVPWYTVLIYVVGILFAVVVLFQHASAVAKITYRQLKGDDFYSMGDARKYVKKNWKATISSPLALLGMMAFLVLCGALIGLLARIPYVGELGFSLGLPLIFAVALFAVFLWVVFIVSLALAPAIVGITGEDTLETVIQVFSTVWSQPWRLVLYEALLKIYAVLGTAILAIFSFKAARLIHWACGLWMGEKMDSIIQVAVRLLPTQCPVAGGLIGDTPAGVGGTLLVSGWIAGIMMILVVFFVLSYSFSICCAGQTLIYLILRQKKDDENLLEKKDQEEEEEEREREEEEQKLEEEKKQAEEAEKEKEVKEEAPDEEAEAAPGAEKKPEEEKE
jgi:Sec-independent protein translocase protein TatA